MEADVVIVGGGPRVWLARCGWRSCMTRMTRRIPNRPSPKKISTCWKKRGKWASTASPEPCSIRVDARVVAGIESEAPIDAEVTSESVWFLTEKGQHKFPIVPPPLRDHGNYVFSINRFVKWMGQKVEQAGITIFTGFAASELLFDEQFGSGRVIGVRTDDKGVDKEGRPKANFEPGYDLHAKITVLAEGSRGSCAKQLIERQKLEDPEHAQTYGIGIKELSGNSRGAASARAK